MIKGEKIRFDIHNILYSVYKFNKTLNNNSIKNIISKHKKEDISFLNNVALNSMRLHLHALKIINKYIKKKLGDHEKILLISAVTQIVFLDFKEYAVINCSVEIAKKLRVYHGFINAVLKRVSKDKKKLRDIKIEFSDLPYWFTSKTRYLSNSEKKLFVKNFCKEPDIHIVFKNKDFLNSFEESIVKTSEISGFLINKKNIEDKVSFIKGEWWVQDFSSFFPIYNLQNEYKYKKYLDACAAPGGKSFQILSKNIKIFLNDKNKKRVEILENNLDRLNFKANLLNEDFTKFNTNEKYDFIIIDSPCSAVGTIRKNPEIFFKSKGPNFKKLNDLQIKLLEKASILLNKNGLILYMVCSFIKNETIDQIDRFLQKNKNFEIFIFKLNQESINFSKLVINNYMLTLPGNILNKTIDGYFAIFLKKIR